MAEKYYKISGETLTAIADRARVMANTKAKMTPAEIIHWLGRVAFIPQGHASSEFALGSFSGTAIGILPTVYKGRASSEFALGAFESSAVGALTE